MNKKEYKEIGEKHICHVPSALLFGFSKELHFLDSTVRLDSHYNMAFENNCFRCEGRI